MQELVAQTWREGLPSGAAFEQLLQFRVRREHVLSDFCGQLWWRLCNKPQCLRLPLTVEFAGELGIDEGGLRKECLQLLLRQLYERTSLFTELEELPGHLWFSAAPDCWSKGPIPDEESPPELYSPDWKDHLPQLAGAIVGLATYNGIYLDLRLHPLIYRFLVKREARTSFEDLAAVHPTLHRSLQRVREAGGADLGLTWNVRLPGVNTDYDLKSGTFCDATATSDEELVQASELGRFAEAYAESVLVGAMRSRVDGFLRSALAGMAVGKAFPLCTATDLELMLCGSPDIGDFKELERSCTYANGLAAESPTVKYLWHVVHGMSEIAKRKLLLFSTGCDRVPISGLKALNFVVALSTASSDHLPTANTCINQLNLPEYTSAEMTRQRLYAALEHHSGFGFA